MKRKNLKQRTFIRRSVIIVVGIITAIAIATQSVGYSQDKKMSLKEKEDAWRAERLKKRIKAERMEFINDSIQYAQAIIAIRNGSWALEASSIAFNNGESNFVTPSTNYVSINNGTGTIQTALDNTNIYSPNGLGGVTLQGNVSNQEINVDSQGNIHYNYIVQGNNVSATVNIMITSNSNQATAYIIPNFGSGNITMSGSIYPYNQAGVIQGTTDYWLTDNTSKISVGLYPTIWYHPMPPPRPVMMPPIPPRPRPTPQRPPGFGGNPQPPGFGGQGGQSRPPGFTR